MQCDTINVAHQTEKTQDVLMWTIFQWCVLSFIKRKKKVNPL